MGYIWRISILTYLVYYTYTDADDCLTLTCSSDGHQYNTCHVSSSREIASVVVQTQLSSTSCNENYSFGHQQTGAVWVDKGCRAEFRVCFLEVATTTEATTWFTKDATTAVTTKDLTTLDTTSTSVTTSGYFMSSDAATSGLCTCACADLGLNLSDPAILQQFTDAMRKEMLIDKQSLSSTKRKLIRIHDERSSSRVMGTVAFSFIMLTITLMVISDTQRVIIWIITLVRKSRNNK